MKNRILENKILSIITIAFLALFLGSNFNEVHSYDNLPRNSQKAVIHHTESPCWTTVKDIDNWHKERGWDGIGYHYVIYCDGSINKGRSLNKKGAHAKGRNNSIGIALVGKDSFTSAQIDSLHKIISNHNIIDIERHHEECPGKGVDIEGFMKLAFSQKCDLDYGCFSSCLNKSKGYNYCIQYCTYCSKEELF